MVDDPSFGNGSHLQPDGVAFAFGSFHLVPREPSGGAITVGTYAAYLRTALEELPCVVGQVALTFDPQASDSPIDLSAPLPRLSQGEPYPDIPFGHIAFLISVADEDQRRLLRGRAPRTGSQFFGVEIHYEYSGPVTIVECLAPHGRPQPSDAVVVARDALAEALDAASSWFTVDVLGPSPFHADFYLAPAPSERLSGWWDLDVETLKTRAYDEYQFYFNDSVFDDLEAAKDALYEGLVSELDMFYRIKQVGAQNRLRWEHLNDLTWALVASQRRSGLRGFGARLFGTTTQLDEAFIALSEFEGTNTLARGVLKTELRDAFRVDEPIFLQAQVEDEFASQQDYPSAQTESLLKLFESRRLGRQELVVLIVSALIGGLAGGSLSALTNNGGGEPTRSTVPKTTPTPTATAKPAPSVFPTLGSRFQPPPTGAAGAARPPGG